jgi:leucyl aminopeptidase (aminopeptidase T)
MMAGTPEERAALAQNVVRRSLGVRRGESVIVECWTHMVPWAAACVLECRRVGAHATLQLEDEETYWASVDSAPARALGEFSPVERAALSQADAYIFFRGPADMPRLRALPEKQRAALLAYNAEWYRVARRSGVRGCRVELSGATEAQAQAFGLDAEAWQRAVLQASLQDPRELARTGRAIAQRLAKGREVVIRHENGTDLKLRLARRPPVVEAGLFTPELRRRKVPMVSLPGGTCTVAVEETFGEGTFVANRPSYPFGQVYEGGRWTFREGRLIAWEYSRGGESFETAWGRAGRGRDQVGLVSVGLNPALVNVEMLPTLEDAPRGVVCVAIGGNRDYGGRNRSPFLRWLVLAGSEVTVDGKPLIRQGEPVLS